MPHWGQGIHFTFVSLLSLPWDRLRPRGSAVSLHQGRRLIRLASLFNTNSISQTQLCSVPFQPGSATSKNKRTEPCCIPSATRGPNSCLSSCAMGERDLPSLTSLPSHPRSTGELEVKDGLGWRVSTYNNSSVLLPWDQATDCSSPGEPLKMDGHQDSALNCGWWCMELNSPNSKEICLAAHKPHQSLGSVSLVRVTNSASDRRGEAVTGEGHTGSQITGENTNQSRTLSLLVWFVLTV